MATYLAFLRAINLGKTRKFPKAEIIAAVEAAGGTDVETYINTGNVRFDLPEALRDEVEMRLEEAFEDAAGFEVPTIVFTPEELTTIAATADRLSHPGRHYVSLLKSEITTDQVEALSERAGDGEELVVEGRAAHLLVGENYRNAKLSNDVVEQLLGVATNRNVNVIRTLVEKWC